MNHFKKIRTMLSAQGLDALLLTEEANRFYASGFHSAGTDGVALVTVDKAYYFTDSRYIESAVRQVEGAEVRLMGRGRSYSDLIGEVIAGHNIRRMGFDDAYMTVADWRFYREKLSCELVAATQLLLELRRVKDEAEIDAITGRPADHRAGLRPDCGGNPLRCQRTGDRRAAPVPDAALRRGENVL